MLKEKSTFEQDFVVLDLRDGNLLDGKVSGLGVWINRWPRCPMETTYAGIIQRFHHWLGHASLTGFGCGLGAKWGGVSGVGRGYRGSGAFRTFGFMSPTI